MSHTSALARAYADSIIGMSLSNKTDNELYAMHERMNIFIAIIEYTRDDFIPINLAVCKLEWRMAKNKCRANLYGYNSAENIYNDEVDLDNAFDEYKAANTLYQNEMKSVY